MKQVIDRPQVSDMGCGFGYYEQLEDITLKDFLAEYKKNTGMWGMINDL